MCKGRGSSVFPGFLGFFGVLELVDFNGFALCGDPVLTVQVLVIDELVHCVFQFLGGGFFWVYCHLVLTECYVQFEFGIQEAGEFFIFIFQVA